ncbi:MAG: nickel pincer cofactor biosynthesis protein LarC [candidate division KSB1 bacterium]|nr:nickel pincer cofactor biosynthesis protein LarC [candidate division KSB1 bacterium]
MNLRIAYFDCFAGISGDMILGALIDAGLPLEVLRTELTRLNLTGFEISTRQVKKHGLRATKVAVTTSETHPHRNLRDIEEIIERSSLSQSITEKALKIFRRIAEAEAGIHGTTIEDIHFHEVGAIDAIVDIVGSLIGLEQLGVAEVFSSPIRLGSGTVKAMHGILPLPAPATLELTKNYPVIKTEISAELTTPTGAAILTTLASPYREPPEMIVQHIGYGAGTRDLEEIPNLLRVFIAQRKSGYQMDQAFLVETNIDDMNPEFYPYLIEKILAQGAMDAYLTPVIMKKGRPGIVFSALTDFSCLDTIIATLYQETTTLGVRINPVGRKKLPRTIEEIDTPLGKVKVKVIEWEGKKKITPEYEECKRIAQEKKIPLARVYEIINRAVT